MEKMNKMSKKIDRLRTGHLSDETGCLQGWKTDGQIRLLLVVSGCFHEGSGVFHRKICGLLIRCALLESWLSAYCGGIVRKMAVKQGHNANKPKPGVPIIGNEIIMQDAGNQRYQQEIANLGFNF